MYSRGENGATDDKIPSCSSKNIELCTNKKLYMYLYSKTIAGLIILDDLLNLLLYQPEYFCNVKEQQTFNCLLDYCQRLISRKFQDNFLYFGLHQTQNFRHQVGDWVSLVRYKEPQIVHLGTHIWNLTRFTLRLSHNLCWPMHFSTCTAFHMFPGQIIRITLSCRRQSMRWRHLKFVSTLMNSAKSTKGLLLDQKEHLVTEGFCKRLLMTLRQEFASQLSKIFVALFGVR